VANFLVPSCLALLFLSVGGHYCVYLLIKLRSLSWPWNFFFFLLMMVVMPNLIENGKGRVVFIGNESPV
jgi:hypothetical protein